VEADGSFNVEIPADTPVQLQVLDEEGLAVASCRWIWVKQSENRGCIGCHEDPELTPENRFVLAVRQPGKVLAPPVEERRTVGFREHVWPIIASRCATAACHASSRTPLRLPNRDDEEGALKAFAALTARGPDLQPLYVDPGRARTSLLAWKLRGRALARPWDRDHGARKRTRQRSLKRMPPEKSGVTLPEKERQTILEWLDLGAPWQAVPHDPPAKARESR
jgi:hypothetical protein